MHKVAYATASMAEAGEVLGPLKFACLTGRMIKSSFRETRAHARVGIDPFRSAPAIFLFLQEGSD
jgi:hypothetical protein